VIPLQQQIKKSKFRKWLYRVAFVLLILLMLLQLHHYDTTLDALAKLNVEQSNDIHNMQKELHSIQLQDLKIKSDVSDLKLKINGQFQDIHNDIPSPDLHKDSKVHSVSAFTPASIVTTTTVTVLTILKGVTSLIPAFN
jgi:hypothetical protein